MVQTAAADDAEENPVQADFVRGVPAGNIAINGGPMVRCCSHLLHFPVMLNAKLEPAQRMISNYAANFGGTGPSGMGAAACLAIPELSGSATNCQVPASGAGIVSRSSPTESMPDA